MIHRPVLILLASALAACAPLHSAEQRAQAEAQAEQAAQLLRAEAPASNAALAPWLVQQRARVAQARSVAQARYETEETACWRRFTVNDCLRSARLERRAALSALRQQELTLNEIERQRRTAERLRQLDEKQQGASGR